MTVQVMVGAECVKVQVAVPEENDAEIFESCRLLKAKVVAEGEAELSPAPGKVMIIFPLTGIVDTVVKAMVCFAVMATLMGSPM